MTTHPLPARRNATTSNPPGADSTGSRASILAAARAEFAAHGLTGARVNTIANRAGVNKQLIYYYFGSKDDLYRSALETVYTEIRTLERSLNLGTLQPAAAMEALIGFSFDYLHEHPDFIALLNHENAAGAPHVRDSSAIRDTNSPLVDLIARTLARGIQAQVFRPGIDPVELYISVAGMSYFFFSNRLTLSSIFGRDLGALEATQAYRRHVVGFAMAGLQP
ncbi:MAG: TetR family transcriptional regulator [Rhodoferax sp.]|nr:TetR family transcriptional regulator [Rhodoferax sp.]MBP9929421.1 TetR family transcriptional regulator [Rhodoferax sp.]HQZ07051.1 TetR family transcriptional regulator [Burkholderiaceae bacterium]